MLCSCLEGLDMFLEHILQLGVRSGCVGELLMHVCATFTPTASTIVCLLDNDTSLPTANLPFPIPSMRRLSKTWHLRSSHEGESCVDKVEQLGMPTGLTIPNVLPPPHPSSAVVTERMVHSHHRRLRQTGPSLHDVDAPLRHIVSAHDQALDL
ncbi:hypothetical protein ARMSODRAFT_965779 [Armillaria solidipes]|uniref:Uncharacterized protein n=1 Tax=Armillaria solidipes TaxID=1076256 RepID=A0A2H3AVS4_9AGAR|nr:hypothetical protein ARMSODRAFT_965779 [Armillaria solidipes]